MATLQCQGLLLSAASRPSRTGQHRRSFCRASLHVQDRPDSLSIELAEWMDTRTATAPLHQCTQEEDTRVITKLHAIADAAADRAEMHGIIGRQRDNWNHLFLHSTNSLALAASLVAGFAPASLRAAPAVLLAASAVFLAAVNKIQPSQLAEEQRNSARLWRQLERELRGILVKPATPPTEADVEEAMDKVLALDKAYPLPLLPGMLEKFPKTVEPARWWPRKHTQRRARVHVLGGSNTPINGWTQELADEMKGVLRVIKQRDEEEYISLGKLALRINRGLAVAGPAIAGLTAIAATVADAPAIAMAGGVLVAVINTMEHGGQVGMVFEMYRNCAGLYRKMQEEIELNLEEGDVDKREHGEVFETKVALQLGRSISDLREHFGKVSSPLCRDEDIKENAGKLL